MPVYSFPKITAIPPDLCFCGRKTVESHEFWFCSTECARQDSLRSLKGGKGHYREGMQDFYIQGSGPERQPRRMASTGHLRSGRSGRNRFADAPPLPQMSPETRARIAPWPEPPADYGKAPTKNATRGEVAAGKHDWSRQQGLPDIPSCAPSSAMNPVIQQLHAMGMPIRADCGMYSLGRNPSSVDGLQQGTTGMPFADLFNFIRSRNGKKAERR